MGRSHSISISHQTVSYVSFVDTNTLTIDDIILALRFFAFYDVTLYIGFYSFQSLHNQIVKLVIHFHFFQTRNSCPSLCESVLWIHHISIPQRVLVVATVWLFVAELMLLIVGSWCCTLLPFPHLIPWMNSATVSWCIDTGDSILCEKGSLPSFSSMLLSCYSHKERWERIVEQDDMKQEFPVESLCPFVASQKHHSKKDNLQSSKRIIEYLK